MTTSFFGDRDAGLRREVEAQLLERVQHEGRRVGAVDLHQALDDLVHVVPLAQGLVDELVGLRIEPPPSASSRARWTRSLKMICPTVVSLWSLVCRWRYSGEVVERTPPRCRRRALPPAPSGTCAAACRASCRPTCPPSRARAACPAPPRRGRRSGSTSRAPCPAWAWPVGAP